MRRQSPRRHTVPAESIRQWLDQALAGEDDRTIHATALALAEHSWMDPNSEAWRTRYLASRATAGRLGLDPRSFSVCFNSLRNAGYLHRTRSRKTHVGRTILTTPASATHAEHTL